MGRGKKKGQKGTEPAELTQSVAQLVIDPEQPSTSESVVVPPEEESAGLTGASRKQKRKARQSKESTPEVKSSEQSAKDIQEIQIKESTPEVESSAKPTKDIQELTVKEPSPEVESTRSIQIAPDPSQKGEESVAQKDEKEEDSGLGLGLGVGKKRPPRKRKPKSTEASGDGSQQASTSAPIAAPQQLLSPTTQQAEQDAFPAMPSSSSTNIWQTQQSSKTVIGYGRGRGLGAPEQRAQQVPGQPPTIWQQPTVGQPWQQPTVGQPWQQPTATPVQPPVRTQQQAPIRSTSSTLSLPVLSKHCNLSIPSKIEGNTIRARPLKVYTNYLPMEITALELYRYDVSFDPERPKKVLPKMFQQFMSKHFPKYIVAYDQAKNFFTSRALPGVTSTEKYSQRMTMVDDNNRTMDFEISIKSTGIVKLDTIKKYMTNGTTLDAPTEAQQSIDVILRQGTLENYIKAGRTFFKRPSRPIDLGDGMEIWTGLFQSAIFTTRPYINIDVAHKGFAKQQPMLAVLEVFGFTTDTPLDQQRRGNYERLKAFLKGLKLVAYIGGDKGEKNKREFMFNEIIEPANVKKFKITNPDGKSREITVADYFTKEKKYKLKYPHLNCFWIGPRDKTIYYPLELLEVAYGQVLNRQLNDRQLSIMVKQAATPPAERLAKIQEIIQDMKYSKNPFFKQFGLKIKEEFIQVQAKVIDPPKLKYRDKLVEPRNGQWRGSEMYQGITLSYWGLIALELDPRASNGETAMQLFRKCGQNMKISMEQPSFLKFNVRLTELQSVMLEALQKKIQMLFVIVPGRGPKDCYASVKKTAERQVGILTQCIKEQTMTRINIQTATNIMLKVNAKLMGVNQSLNEDSLPKCLFGGGVMIVGADVTHPSPDQSNIPSIAAVTASIDLKCFVYNTGLSIQTPKKEIIVEFEDMMLEHLKLYRSRQKVLPKKIYVFRDGVSDGQFAEVMANELKGIYKAYATLSGGQGKPEVLFILVQKRHHTRLFTDLARSQNVEPGTVVDKDIVHARELDFYLVSHQAIKGTARPTRYHAVCNDGRLPADEVEQLAYYLCHLYSRCARAVSYPTPTYYAHLACMRARALTHGEKFNNAELERSPKRLQVLDKMLTNSRMFFV